MKAPLCFFLVMAQAALAQEEQLPSEEKAKDVTLVLAEKMRDDGWAKINNYEYRDFYYRDENGRPQALPVQEKIAVLFSVGKREQNLFFNKLSGELNRAASIENFGAYFVVINLTAGTDSLVVLKNLMEGQEKHFPQKPVAIFLPIFTDKNRRQHVTLNEIVFKAKTPIRENLVKERLAKLGKFTINSLAEETPQTYRLVIGKLESPPNLFVLANLISEDPWFYAAKPDFNPIGMNLLANLSVTPKGWCGINQQRFLNLTLEIFDENTVVDPKLIPQFGEGDFLPANFIGQTWLEKGKPTIEKIDEGNRRALKITWPFKYFVPGEHHIFNIAVPYKALREGKLMDDMVSIRTSFQVSSVIHAADPVIQDIEPLRPLKLENFLPTGGQVLPTGEILATTEIDLGWQEKIYQNGNWLGLILLAPAILAIFILILGWLKKWRAATIAKKSARKEREQPWLDLREAVEILEKWTEPPIEWEVSYKMVNDKISIVLQRDFGIHPAIEVDKITDLEIQKMVTELRRVFSNEPPNKQEISELKNRLREFLKAHDIKEGR